MKKTTLINILAVSSIVGVLALSQPARAAAAGTPALKVTADTNLTAAASGGTNAVDAGVGVIDSIQISKSSTQSVCVVVTTDQGLTVYSNTLTTTAAAAQPRVFPTDVNGANLTNVMASTQPVGIPYSGRLILNAYKAAVTGITVTVQTQVQR